MTILLVANDFARFAVLAARLRQEQDIDVVSASNGSAAFEYLKAQTRVQLTGETNAEDQAIDLVIVDEQLNDMAGIQFVKQLVMVNPLVNTVIVSALSAEDFHEATEGLGVLMRLPLQPKESDATELLAILAKIAGLMQPRAKKVTGI